MLRRPARLAIVLTLSLLLAGCGARQGEDDAEAPATPTGTTAEGATPVAGLRNASAPVWRVGDFWTYDLGQDQTLERQVLRLDAPCAAAEGSCIEVLESSASQRVTYLSPSTLASIDGAAPADLRWPLEVGATWTLSDGTEEWRCEALPAVGVPVAATTYAAIPVRCASGSAAVTMDYAPDVRAVARVRSSEGAEGAAGGATLVDQGNKPPAALRDVAVVPAWAVGDSWTFEAGGAREVREVVDDAAPCGAVTCYAVRAVVGDDERVELVERATLSAATEDGSLGDMRFPLWAGRSWEHEGLASGAIIACNVGASEAIEVGGATHDPVFPVACGAEGEPTHVRYYSPAAKTIVLDELVAAYPNEDGSFPPAVIARSLVASRLA